jgi:membrane-bound serine protease (ClpP class)
MKRLLLYCLFYLLTFGVAFSSTVHVITIDGSINPASADLIHSSIQKAISARAECLIIQLNTPGGLLKSTRSIVTDILTSSIPVVVYVTPSGSQSASAGVFITLAAHVAAMAPGTNIGAAHPVALGEQMDSLMMEKATNDAAAFIRTISEKRHRNVAWAEDAVRKSLSVTETEALKLKIIDTVAANLETLLRFIDGKELETVRGNVIVQTANAEVITYEKTFRQEILEILSDPNIAYILLMLGIYGLLFELYNPGTIVPGVVGFISLILAFYSLHTLPINYAGIALIIFAIVLFILELKIVSHGLLSIAGVLSLALGSLMLIQTESPLEFVSISWQTIAAVIFFTVVFFVFALGIGIQAQRRKPTTGIQGLIGEIGEAITELNPDGKIRVHGEIWSASCPYGLIEKGSKVKVENVDNLHLTVRKLTTS